MSKSEKRQRTVLFLGIRWFPEEKEQVVASAKAAGISSGEFLRRAALSRRIVAKGDTKQMNEILKLGGLQKHLYSEMQKQGMMTTELSKQFADTLAALQKTLMKFRADSLNNIED
ncbi:mobilization protein (plasmid) [Edwardsiella piscicida]|nr:plasmid mobilization protein MobA [Edwardsiella piscicida]EKS7814720.1 mobilization protein [Edwardsiella piscicida]UCQ13157.1 mobilization protein [Edwardsiella tarda]UJT80892.1 mobilization protein [Edwardsiella piscicida]